MDLKAETIIQSLEHTKLHFSESEEVESSLKELCAEANHYGFATVCVRPEHILKVREYLGSRTNVAVAGVVGFPAEPVTFAKHAEYPVIGACNSTTKLQEISCIQIAGGEEVDAVLNVAFLKTDLEVGGSFTQKELHALRMASGDLPLKLILEVDLLNDFEISKVIQMAVEEGVDFIKTSTGYLKSDAHNTAKGATPERIAFIRECLNAQGAKHVKIKASGGIRTLADAEAVLKAGADRIGSSACVAISREALGLDPHTTSAEKLSVY